jgi:prepilin-type N-terminal cleavage/methylation domain-containing protein
MKRGFTILELLVASLLLGMLVTILTMIFNQSSIAWRTGVAGVADLDQVRDNIAEVREEADNVFFHGSGGPRRITGLWKKDGSLRTRACDAADTDAAYEIVVDELKGMNGNMTGEQISTVRVGSGAAGKSMKTYTVGVMSCGPDRKPDTWDDITTWPDEIEL